MNFGRTLYIHIHSRLLCDQVFRNIITLCGMKAVALDFCIILPISIRDMSICAGTTGMGDTTSSLVVTTPVDLPVA